MASGNRAHGLRPRPGRAALFGTAFLAAACSSDSPTNDNGANGPRAETTVDCSLPLDLIHDGGVGLDGIPALTNPPVAGVWDPEADFLRANDRVISLELDGDMYAIPHRILWWHEIVNFDRGDERVAVTYCPLTGSSMVYDRNAVGGVEFRVSGLLFQNNLIMYDRGRKRSADGNLTIIEVTPTHELTVIEGGSLWPQMMREARCGNRNGQELPMVAAVEITWDRWRELHPEGQVVVIPSTQIGTPYDRYPYGNYEDLDSRELIYPQTLTDFRRPPKERVLGILDGSIEGKAYPFETLTDAGPALAINDEVGGDPVLILWDGNGQGAYAYSATANGQELTISLVDGRFVDEETGSVWGWDGRALEGSLESARLEPIDDAFVAFWFAWRAFQPATELWEPS